MGATISLNNALFGVGPLTTENMLFSRGQHPAEKRVRLLLLLHQFNRSLLHQVLKVGRVFLQQMNHVVHDVHLPVQQMNHIVHDVHLPVQQMHHIVHDVHLPYNR